MPVVAVSAAPAFERTGNPSLVLPEVLRELYLGRRTGLLHVSRGTDRVSLSFAKGEVASGSSTFQKGRLGETMVRHGLLALQDLVRAIVVVHRDRRRLGPVLMEMGIIDAPGLQQALVLHLREMLLTALAWEEAAHAFTDQELVVESAEDLSLRPSTGELILEVVRRMSSLEMVRVGLGDLDRILAAVPVPVFRLDRITLNPAERHVLSRVDGKVSARSIIETAAVPVQDVERGILGLFCTGVIEFRPRVIGAQRPAAPESTKEGKRSAAG